METQITINQLTPGCSLHVSFEALIDILELYTLLT